MKGFCRVEMGKCGVHVEKSPQVQKLRLSELTSPVAIHHTAVHVVCFIHHRLQLKGVILGRSVIIDIIFIMYTLKATLKISN